MSAFDALDDFAGPGGWDEGARMIGLTTLGFEWDQAACDTAEAAGHARIKVDVSLADAAVYRGVVRGYLGSPPCTLFSPAGKGTGRDAIELLADGIRRIFAEDDCRDEIRQAIYDEITLPARTAENDARPDSKKWTAEKVGTKAREDAFIASLVLEPARRIMQLDPEWIGLEQVPAVLPLWQVYTHELRKLGWSVWTGIVNAADYGVPQTRERAILMASRVRTVTPPEPTHSRDGDKGDLFGVKRERWVSMAQALGWDTPVRFGDQERSAIRQPDEPAATVMFGDSPHRKLTRFVSAGVTGEGRPKDPQTQPPDTLTSKGTAYWCYDRPATTVVGSYCPDVIAAPGYRTETSRQNAEGSVRVTVQEAGVLQSFPADYPWQGSRTKQFQQVGNAIPPLLAAHVLSALTGARINAAA